MRNREGPALEVGHALNVVAYHNHVAVTVCKGGKINVDSLFSCLHYQFNKGNRRINATGVECVHEFSPGAEFHQFDVKTGFLFQSFGFCRLKTCQ